MIDSNKQEIFNFHDVSLEFFVKCCYRLDQVVRQTMDSILPDDSELVDY